MGTYYSYLQLAEELPTYLTEMGYTHVELLPPPSTPMMAPGATR